MRITTHPTAPKEHTAIAFDSTRADTRHLECEGNLTLSLGVEGMSPLTRRKVISLVRRTIAEANMRKVRRVVLDLAVLPEHSIERRDLMRLVGENTHLAAYEFTPYKKEPKDGWRGVEELALVGSFAKDEVRALKVGEVVAAEVNACRTLANMPGGDMTPAVLARSITRSARGTGAKVRVLGVPELTKLKMGALLGVGRGAKEAPKLIVVEYRGGKKGTPPVVLVGKGITFDTGGLSLKTGEHMLDMHLDMSGGAAVAHAVLAAARLKVPVNAVALIPAAENAIGHESYRPGDVLTSMSGTTIDILNTDAEGRVVLADALTYAKRYNPSLVVDVATLTGAALVALGTRASAVMSRDDALAARICALGEVSGDYCWPLPLWEEYKDMVKGRFGDIANVPIEGGRYGGTIGGGMFLAEFAEGYPWVHLDIAPRMTSDKGDYLAQGATGEPVRLLVRLLEEEGGPGA